MVSANSRNGSNGGLSQNLLVSTAALALFWVPAAGWAQTTDSGKIDEIQEVVVTATREGATSLQKTPMAVTAFTATDLDQSGVTNASQLVQYTPNLKYSINSLGGEYFIRGVGSTNVFAGSDPDVTQQIDGVYIARPYAQMGDFLDVGQVEVLRGPQGTLYGRNAVGGVINITSKAPTDDFHAGFAETVGNFNLTDTQAYVSGPLIKGTLDGSVAINYVNHSPYIRNIGDPSLDGVANADHGGIRAQLAWRPTDNVLATTHLDWSSYDENQVSTNKLLTEAPIDSIANSLLGGNGFTVAINAPQTLQQKMAGVSENVDVDLTPDLILKSITAYRSSSYTQWADADATELVTSVAYNSDSAHQFSQEFDLQGNYDKWTFVTGLYYFIEDDRGVQQAIAPLSVFSRPGAPSGAAVEANPDQHTTSGAAFAQVDYAILPTVNLTAGGRYTSELKKMSQDLLKYTTTPGLGSLQLATGVPAFVAENQERYDAFTPKGAIDWQVTPNVMSYVSVTRGFKSGGNNAAAATLASFAYKPEYVTSYEGGVKSDWIDHRLRLNLTVFDYDYTNLQVQEQFAPGVVQIVNAANATVHGVEFESQAKPYAGVQLTANLSYLDAKYQSYSDYPLSPVLVGQVNPALITAPPPGSPAGTPSVYDASGNTLVQAPRYSFSLAAQYTHDIPGGSAFGRVEYYWQDRIFFDPTNVASLSQPAYGLLNVDFGFTSSDKLWNLNLVVANATDRGYIGLALPVPLGTGYTEGAPGNPRTVSLRLSRSW